jgi:DNA-binding PadR family transcriptional regulator
MSKPLGAFQWLLLMAVVHLDDDAYGVTIHRLIEERTGRDVTSGAIYTTLERLERQGYVTSSLERGGDARGGRPKRYYRLTATGRRALAREHASWQGMSRGLLARLGKP